jgi:ABC-2 type transport system permease protein
MVARLLTEYARFNLAKRMEYRLNFFLQFGSMFVNDIVTLFFWYLFFQAVPSLNGWTFSDTLFLFAFAAFFYGLLFTFFGNLNHVAEDIANGDFDFYLTLPADEFFHPMMTSMNSSAVGDLAFGTLVMAVLVPLASWPLLVFVTACSMIIYLSLIAMANSLSFWIGRSSELVERYNWGLISLLVYPQGAFSGFTKLLLFTVLPVGIISSVPLSLVKTFSLELSLLLGAFAVLLLGVSRLIFYQGLKQYQSGSNIQVRI